MSLVSVQQVTHCWQELCTPFSCAFPRTPPGKVRAVTWSCGRDSAGYLRSLPITAGLILHPNCSILESSILRSLVLPLACKSDSD